METFYLSQHAHACLVDGHIVILDLKNDNYIAASPRISPFLYSLTDKRTVDIIYSDIPKQLRAELSSTIQSFIRDSILSCSPSKISATGTRQYVQPTRDLTDALFDIELNITPRMVWTFFKCWIIALYLTRVAGIKTTVEYVGSYRTRSRHGPPLDYLVYCYRTIRPFFYTAHNHCYFDCTVLSLFLKHYGHRPRWVFAVAMDPFHAHCWVQVDNLLVTDELSMLVNTKPILQI